MAVAGVLPKLILAGMKFDSNNAATPKTCSASIRVIMVG